MKTKFNVKLGIICLLGIVLVEGCSTGKNTPGTRVYHEATTRYNIFHNAEQIFNETLENQFVNIPLKYDSIVPFYPSAPTLEKTITGGPFDPVVEKASRAIQEHSISAKPRRNPSQPQTQAFQHWLSQDEFNPFIHNVWLLLGKAHLLNGDYAQAISVFLHIQHLFKQDVNLITETEIWLLRTYSEMDRAYDAANIAYALQSKTIPSYLNDLYTETYAGYLINKQEYVAAVPWLKKAIQGEKRFQQKKRLQFLLGQIHALNGERKLSFNAFEQVKGIRTPFAFTLNATIAQLSVTAGTQELKTRESLRKMLHRTLTDKERKIIENALTIGPGDNTFAEKTTENRELSAIPTAPKERLKTDIVASQEHDSLYQQAYQAYRKGDTETVQSAFARFSEKYPASGLIPQFMLLNALSYARIGDAVKTEKLMSELIEKFPQDAVSHPAQNILDGISKGRKPAKNTSMQITWNANRTNSEKKMTACIPFSTNPKVPHLLLLTYNQNFTDKNRLLFFIADFNFTHFKLRTFNFSPILFMEGEVLKVESFSSFDDLSHYMQLLQSTSLFNEFIEEGVSPIFISEVNFKILQQHSSMDKYQKFYAESFGIRPIGESISQPESTENSTLIPVEKNEKIVSLDEEKMSVPQIEAPIIEKPLTTEALQLQLEQKTAEALQQKQKSQVQNNRDTQLKERKKEREKKIQQREKAQKERQRKREAAIKQREHQREQRMRSQQRQ